MLRFIRFVVVSIVAVYVILMTLYGKEPEEESE